MNTHCKNPACGRKIKVGIFIGEDFCSADCKKVLGLLPPAGNLVFLTPEEERMVKDVRNA